MCKFFSAVVTPQGIFFSEDWSHAIVRDRLGDPGDAIDIEYDEERGLEVHEPLQLPEWFNVTEVAPRCKALYEGIKRLEAEFQRHKNDLDAEFGWRWDELDADFTQLKDELDAEFKKRKDEWWAEYGRHWDELDMEFQQSWDKLAAEFRQRKDALRAEYRAKLAAFEGYVPPLGEYYTKEELDRIHEGDDDDEQP